MESMSDAPIVFVHRGGSPVLRFAVEKALEFGNKVVLLGDANSVSHVENLQGVKTVRIEALMNSDVRTFIESYQHRSTNSVEFELFCIVRWILLRNFCHSNNYFAIFHFDHDSIPFFNVGEIKTAIQHKELMLSGGFSGHASFITKDMLSEFVSFLLAIYKPVSRIDCIQNKLMIADFEVRRSHGELGGISDMSLLNLFQLRYPRLLIQDGQQPMELDGSNGSVKGVFDDNINATDHYQAKMSHGRTIKAVHFENGIPLFTALHGKRYRALNIHLQGTAKNLLSFIRHSLDESRLKLKGIQ